MKLPNLPFSSVFHKLFSKKTKPLYVRNVVSDWERLIAVFLIISIMICSVTVYFFLKLNNGELFTEGRVDAGPVEVINRKKMVETNAFYDAKATAFENIHATTSIPIDPSL